MLVFSVILSVNFIPFDGIFIVFFFLLLLFRTGRCGEEMGRVSGGMDGDQGLGVNEFFLVAG